MQQQDNSKEARRVQQRIQQLKNKFNKKNDDSKTEMFLRAANESKLINLIVFSFMSIFMACKHT